jgi:hypothetical protein
MFVSMAPKLSIPKQALDNDVQQFFAGYSFSASRSPSSSHFRLSGKSITSSLAGIPSHGSRSSMTLPGYEKEDYENNDVYGGMSCSNTIRTIASSDDISEYELDQNHYHPKQRLLNDNNMKHRSHLYQNHQNPRLSQYMDED